MLIMIAAVAALQALPAGEPRGAPSEAQFARVRAELDRQLLDYPSARFRDVRADGTRVCGYVNSKNAMGGYVGWRLFGALDSSAGAVLVIDDPHMTEPICTPALMNSRGDYSEQIRKK